MAANIKGTAVVWSIGGAITMTGAIVNATDPSMIQSMSYNRTAENTKIKDNGGDVKTIIYHGPMKTLSISVVPSGASNSISDAVTSKEAHMVAPGSTVTISEATYTTQIEGNWIVVSAKENRTVDGVVTVDLELENAGQEDLSTSAS